MKKHFQSEKGITLIELLLVLSVLTIAGIVVTAAMLNSLNAYKTTAEHINLSQEANILIETISNLHKQNKECVVSYNATTRTISLNNQPFSEDKYEVFFSYNASKLDEDQLVNLTSINPVTIWLKLLDQHGNEFEVQTTLRRLE